MLMPAFRDWPEEANVIARILAGYGELELSLARVVGYALSPTSGETYLTGIRKGLRLLFHRRGELARLELANLFLAEELQASGLGEAYAETMGAIEICRQIRNMFAHCAFATLKHGQPTDGLFFVSLENAVNKKGDKIELLWQQAFYPRLQEIELYFEYAAACLQHLNSEMWTQRGRQSPLPNPRPSKMQPPPKHVAASPNEVKDLPPKI
jgi:hypothetical protein